MTASVDSYHGPSDAPTAREVSVRQRKPSSKDDLLEGYRTALRQEVREQELAALVAEITQLRAEASEHHVARCVQHNEIVAQLMRIQAPAPATPASLEALASHGLGNHNPHDVDIPEGFELVTDAFLDFIEIADLVMSAIVKRFPLNAKVRAFYNNKGQRELQYREKGIYGLNQSMYMATLTMVTDDPDLGPYIKGVYTEYGQVITMSPEQIARVTSETLVAVRELWKAATDAT